MMGRKVNKKILIIEDASSVLQILAGKLNDEGFKVLGAEDGEEGLKLAFKEHPDLILLDIIMPKIDGITVLKKLRADDWGKDVPVIILTDLSDAETVADALENNVYEFLVKADWKLEDVVKKVKEKLRI